MSTGYRVRCETCEADGPEMWCNAGGVALLDDQVADLDASSAWKRWLGEHGYHRLRLMHEHEYLGPIRLDSTGSEAVPAP